MTCSQKGCTDTAVSWMMWPDGKVLYNCERHERSARGVLAVLGYAVQINALPADPWTCREPQGDT